MWLFVASAWLKRLGGVETEKSQGYLYNKERAGVGDSFPVVGPN